MCSYLFCYNEINSLLVLFVYCCLFVDVRFSVTQAFSSTAHVKGPVEAVFFGSNSERSKWAGTYNVSFEDAQMIHNK